MPKKGSSLLRLLFLSGLLLDVTYGARSYVFVDGILVDRLTEDAGLEAVSPPSGPPSFELRDVLNRKEEIAPEDPEWNRRSEAAARTFKENRWEAALREYQALLRRKPDHLPSIERAAVAASLAHRYGVANAYYAQVIQARPDDVPFLVGWAGALLRSRRFDEASSRLDSASRLEPTNLSLRYNQRILQVALGQQEVDPEYWAQLPTPQLAEIAAWLNVDRVELSALLSIDGFEQLTRDLLGMPSAEGLEEVAEGLRTSQRAVQAKDWPSAIIAFTAVGERGVARYSVNMEWARCLMEAGQMGEALNRLWSLYEAHPDRLETGYNLGFALLRSAQYDAAMDLFDEILQHVPSDPEVRFARVCALAGAGRMEEAWPEFSALAEAYPDRIPLWMEGDRPYLQVLRANPRYPGLLGESPDGLP